MTRSKPRTRVAIAPPRSGAMFRFNRDTHTYEDLDGNVLPHITGMLIKAGHVNPDYYTEESRIRGTAVHNLTAEYDLGALEHVSECVSIYKGWLCAHAHAMATIRPTTTEGARGWDEVEQASAHRLFRYGGRPDRIGLLWKQRSAVDLKSGAKAKHHRYQTALQVILREDAYNLPAFFWKRYALYLSPDGKFKLDPHDDPKDLEEARRIIAHCCGMAA